MDLTVNMRELLDWRGESMGSISCYAGVTPELMQDALDGKAELSDMEVMKLADHLGIPYTAAVCEKLIVLDGKRYRHRAMLQELNRRLCYIMKMAVMESRAAKDYLKRHAWDYGRGITAIYGDLMDGKPVTYSRYLCVRGEIADCLYSIEIEERDKDRRGVDGDQETVERKKIPYFSEFLKSAEHIEQITAEHGESGALWEMFTYLSNVMAGYMVESKKRERKDEIRKSFGMQEGGAV